MMNPFVVIWKLIPDILGAKYFAPDHPNTTDTERVAKSIGLVGFG